MPRLFGTDGIRGVANVDLKPTLAYALGRATAHRLVGPGGAMIVGQDTRRSGDMFVAAIAAGATSLGVDVHRVGVVPTPALAFLAGTGPFAAGIMVSASHNPAEDNGLKVLDAAGLKLDDDVEDELERVIWTADELDGVPADRLGLLIDAGHLLAEYLAHRTALAGRVPAAGLHIVLDCATGEVFGPTSALLGTLNPDGTGNPLLWSDLITENPALGATEEWEIHNFTVDAHPIHVHLVKFKVLGRGADGTQAPEAWEAGFKDTVIAYPGEITRIKATYDLPGFYVWHCHIVEHEDNEMMRPYRIGPVQPGQPGA